MTRAMPWGAPIGNQVTGWIPPALPSRDAMIGAHVRLDPLSAARDADQLWDAFAEDPEGRGWTYLPNGPFDDRATFHAFIARSADSEDPRFFAIRPAGDDRAAGFASFLRMTPAAGSIEVGFIHFAPRLQRSFAATEAMHLMAARAFDLGYRRYEWKCDALNTPSRAAAARLGFSYEGTFRQATIYKGRNRDTAWFAITDGDWPAVGGAHRDWLSPANRDAAGRPIRSLADMTRPLLVPPL
ncbi:MAG: RimJ/RimL family protein N-acetyltransferase [Paracoccaceae bacterium]|jgi:RimJ/RimL family protein N-acetyltransferase